MGRATRTRATTRRTANSMSNEDKMNRYIHEYIMKQSLDAAIPNYATDMNAAWTLIAHMDNAEYEIARELGECSMEYVFLKNITPTVICCAAMREYLASKGSIAYPKVKDWQFLNKYRDS